MRQVLTDEIKNERYNKDAIGLYNASVASSINASDWNKDVELQEKEDKKITKQMKEVQNLKALLEMKQSEIENLDKAGNAVAKNNEIENAKAIRSMYEKSKAKLEKLSKASANAPRLVKKETQRGVSPTWETAADKFVKGKSHAGLNMKQSLLVNKHRKILQAIDHWRTHKTATKEDRIKNIKYFTNQKLINIQEFKRQFKLKDLK